MDNYRKNIESIVENLCREESYEVMYRHNNRDIGMPSIEELEKLVDLCQRVLFPGYFGHLEIQKETMRYYIGANTDRIYRILAEQIKRGYCFDCAKDINDKQTFCNLCEKNAGEAALKFIENLPEIRRLLSTDVVAAYEGDPAAKSYGETIFCYPSITVLTHHRIAHCLLTLGVPLIPRIIAEMAHSRTGIDIHPGATIGEKFFIDHGTGVVIGETCIIGRNVRLYQGVTLGAKSFPMDENGNPIKNIPRHPIVEDDVIIYAGATVLGRVTIGAGAMIGGNVWVTYDVPKGGKVLQAKTDKFQYENGGGI